MAEIAPELKARNVEIGKDVHDTPWNALERVIRDDQGHMLDFGEAL